MDVGVAADEAAVSAPSADDFDAWVAARSRPLLRFAYLMTGNQHAAEEALATALAKAFEKWSTVRRMADRDAYVRRMIVNAHISWWRRFGRRESSVAEVRGAGRSGADHATTISEADAVWRLCAELPPRQRASVVLRFYEDLGYPEIAAVLACPEATVRSHIHRALSALRTMIEDQENDDG
jgi:RNA polymerase sigma-70 factor (sigma-E family)